MLLSRLYEGLSQGEFSSPSPVVLPQIIEIQMLLSRLYGGLSQGDFSSPSPVVLPQIIEIPMLLSRLYGGLSQGEFSSPSRVLAQIKDQLTPGATGSATITTRLI
jgi:hypothetical protein